MVRFPTDVGLKGIEGILGFEYNSQQNLEQLEIEGYGGSGGGGTPSWWNANWASNLITLELYNCSKWEFLPPLGHLPFLKKLTIKKMKAVRSIGSEFYASNQVQLSSKTIFPSLEQLTIYYMRELKDWYKIEEEGGGGGFELFPRLKTFRIGKCPKLRGSIFQFPPSNFNQLHVQIGNSGVPDNITEGLIEVHCDSVSTVTEWLQNLTSLSSLHSLCFSYCFELESLPSNLINNLSTLRILNIVKCSNIKSLPEEGLPASLQELLLKGCKKLESLPSYLINLSTLRKLEIVNCRNIKSLPEEGLPASLQELHLYRCYDLAKRCMNEYWQKMIAHIPIFKVDKGVVTEDNKKSFRTCFGNYSYAAEEEEEE